LARSQLRRKARRLVTLSQADLAAIADVLAKVAVEGDRYPAHLQARVGR
jgi:hypothetical protein